MAAACVVPGIGVTTITEGPISNVAGKAFPGFCRDLVLNKLAGSIWMPRPLRRRVLSAYGLKVGRASTSPNVWFKSSNVSIGDGNVHQLRVHVQNDSTHHHWGKLFARHGGVFVTACHNTGRKERRAGAPRCRTNDRR